MGKVAKAKAGGKRKADGNEDNGEDEVMGLDDAESMALAMLQKRKKR